MKTIPPTVPHDAPPRVVASRIDRMKLEPYRPCDTTCNRPGANDHRGIPSLIAGKPTAYRSAW